MFKCVFTGYLGKDPQVNFSSKDGKKYVHLSVATKIFKPAQESETVWLSVAVFNKSAEFIEMHAKKGTRVLVEGRPGVPTIWNSHTGDHVNLPCIADSIEILDKIEKNEIIEQQTNQSNYVTKQQQAFPPKHLQGAKVVSGSNMSKEQQAYDEDIPF